ncbi:replication initiation factor domain-containing protein, partial [Acetobacter farinalis]
VMRFDYYSASVPRIPEVVFDTLKTGLSDVVSDIQQEPKGMLNYERAHSFLSPSGERVCMLLSGGSNGAPHIRASGMYSERVAGLIRASWRDHRVSRLDVAEDFDGPGTWHRLESLCLSVARSAGLKVTQCGDFREDRDETSGRTWYFGSRQSLAMVRLYEKGKQMASKARYGEPPASPDWVRLELEMKPQNRDAKERAARLTPAQCWGVSHWTAKLSQRVLAADVERVKMTIERDHDDIRALRHMIEQYAGVMDRVSDQLGGEDALLNFMQRMRRELRRDAARAAVVPVHEQSYSPSSAVHH